MTEEVIEALIINGWAIYAHPLFLDQLEIQTALVESLAKKIPESYHTKNPSKLLAAMKKVAFEVIPQDPTRPEYRQGDTLGEEHKHWFRVKFLQQYRLFFRYSQAKKVIVLAWVNNSETKRAYESDDDAYKIFKKMLKAGRPPDNWDSLLDEAKAAEGRREKVASALAKPTIKLIS